MECYYLYTTNQNQEIMKKMYLLSATAMLLFSISSCQQNAKAAPENEPYALEDTTAVAEDTAMAERADAMTDTTSVSGKTGTKLPDTISVKTTRKKFDTSGKFALANTRWKLVELNGKEVKNNSGKDYILTLNSKTGKITAYAGCNNIMGSYLMKEDSSLTFLYVGATKMACPDMKTEEKFMAALTKTDRYMIEGNRLHLHKGEKKILAQFEAVP